MNKNLKNLIRYSKVINIILITAGFMLLIFPIYMWYLSVGFPFPAMIVLIFFSIIMFMMAYNFNKFNKNIIGNKGWMNEYKNFRFLNYFLLFIVVLNLGGIILYSIGYFFRDVHLDLLFIIGRVIVLCVIIFVLIFSSYYMKEYKNYESKLFPEWSYDGIDLIEELLIKNEIDYKKEGEKRVNFFVRYSEIFRLEDDVLIKLSTSYKRNQKNDHFHPKSIVSLSVSICPITENNKEKIKMLKNLIDELDKKYD